MPLPKSSKEALNLGEKYYFTGRPCRYNHVAKRNAKNWLCVDCKYPRRKDEKWVAVRYFLHPDDVKSVSDLVEAFRLARQEWK